MALTRDFKETVQARVQRDPKFRESLITEAAGALLAGDVEAGKTILRDYINATVGFEKLGAAVHKSPKSLMRMFGEKGNPRAQNLFSVFAYIQKQEKIKLAVHPEPA
jgi:hypothetical protein